jgi:transcriptional regulator with XRE-family HTH domain
MKDRILQFLESEKISPAEFADKIGVQRSSMSHILNGRNHPSAAFIQKMLQTYPHLDSRWLMIGVGTMNTLPPGKQEIPSSLNTPSLYDMVTNTSMNGDPVSPKEAAIAPESPAMAVGSKEQSESFKDFEPAEAVNKSLKNTIHEKDFSIATDSMANAGEGKDRATGQVMQLPSLHEEEKELEQILFFYKDKTFRVYRPS